MVAGIGLMIGAYILTKMWMVLCDCHKQKHGIMTVVFAGITAIIAVFCMYNILVMSEQINKLLDNIPY